MKLSRDWLVKLREVGVPHKGRYVSDRGSVVSPKSKN